MLYWRVVAQQKKMEMEQEGQTQSAPLPDRNINEPTGTEFWSAYAYVISHDNTDLIHRERVQEEEIIDKESKPLEELFHTVEEAEDDFFVEILNSPQQRIQQQHSPAQSITADQFENFASSVTTSPKTNYIHQRKTPASSEPPAEKKPVRAKGQFFFMKKK